jgi:hypothetical protein
LQQNAETTGKNRAKTASGSCNYLSKSSLHRHPKRHLYGEAAALARFKEQDFTDRQKAANEAKQALLDRFKAKPAEDDPAVQARKAERQAVVEARAKREEEKARLKVEREEREAAERVAREAAEAEALRLAEEEAQRDAVAKAEAEKEQVARILADEVDRKAKRDAKYAARKARTGR